MGSPILENGLTAHYRIGESAHAGVIPLSTPTQIRDQRGGRANRMKELSVKRQGQSRIPAINSWAMGEFRVGGQLS
jgi:hypothetical protein